MPAITFQSVDNEYEWGTYFDFNVLIMTKNGYMNATKLCNDGNKRFKHWLENKGSMDLIDELEKCRIPSDGNLLITITGGNNPIYRGTYVHPELIPSIASWTSAAHALKVNRILISWNIKEQTKVIIHEKDKIIDEQAIENMSLKEMLQKSIENSCKDNAELKLSISNLTDEVSKLSLDNQITHEKLDIAQDTLNIVVEDRVIKPEDKGMTNTVIIYEYELNKFRIFRVQKRSANKYVKRYLSMNPNAVKFAEIDYNPNSVNYFIRFKEQSKGNIKWYYNRFELLNITKDQLKEFIMKINEEKYELEKSF
jgi:hypothetical protein